MRLIEFLKLSVLSICVLHASGCINITEHIYNASCYRPYDGTEVMYDAFTEIFVQRPDLHSNNEAKTIAAHIYAFQLAPYIFIDFPCEAVFDTLTLPFDVFNLP